MNFQFEIIKSSFSFGLKYVATLYLTYASVIANANHVRTI